ncbi:MAG: hypothetical protein NW224_26340 [Leptolyngbyaceae cyanobacterium bins.302]|nr:hypothetical protein [Leptolyngbyaceae cyanobacterium bins.302]
MTNEANDIFTQAKNGSVAAIIQVLNEKLTDSGVRTRAIFADGMLQLLCEGQTLDQLEQPVLVERIRYTLENIAPRNIRKVNIYSRIVREQQLLWLDEINRDRENQVLWSEEITLKQPNLLKRLQDDWSIRRADGARSERGKSSSSKSNQRLREKRQFWRGLLGGALVSGLLLAGWLFYQRYGETAWMQPASVSTDGARSSDDASPPSQPQTVATKSDAFADAVRLAERTSRSSQTAQSAAEWLNLAAQWQQASDFMAQVPATDSRHQTAQDRVVEYRKNSEIALQKAKQVQTTESNTLPAQSPDSTTGQL